MTFDIDANGIVKVAAKDLGTGKEQSISITASSGLSDEEIQRMVKDAEANAEADKQKTELIAARNQLDTLVYSTEKSLKEFGEKVDATLRGEVETELSSSKNALAKEDVGEIKASIERLNTLNAKLAEKVYSQSTTSENAQSASSNEGAAGGEKKKDDDDVVDADFKEV